MNMESSADGISTKDPKRDLADVRAQAVWPINPEAAMSAAFMITASGMSSKTAPSTSIVRQALSPQTEQHLLLPTPAPTHSSIGLPAIQTRFDWAESLLNELSLISRVSRIGSMFSGSSASLNFMIALCRCWYVASQRGQVPPALTSRCQTIGNCLVPPFSLFAGLSQPHFWTVSVAVPSFCGAAVISTALVVSPQHESDMPPLTWIFIDESILIEWHASALR